jgi:hypothetical protein
MRRWSVLSRPAGACSGALGALVVLAAACSSSSAGTPAAGGDGGGGGTDGGSDGPLACPPADLAGWQAPAYRHAQMRQPAACTAQLITDFYDACLGASSSQSACNQSWGSGEDTAHATCQNCLVTQSSAMLWGPLVDFGNTVSINVAGCIELLDPAQVACATAAQQADACQHQACDASCPVTTASSFADWKACIVAASSGECMSYLQAASCLNTEADGGAAASCVTGMTFEDQYLAIAKVFCGM